jgi:glycosyltransferase involved in cell wall biosynthesis
VSSGPVLLVGYAPFDDSATRRYAGQFRTWQVLAGLRAAGLEVVVLGGKIPGTFAAGAPPWLETEALGARVIAAPMRQLEGGRAIRQLVRSLAPSCLASAGSTPAACACAFAGELPVWADLHGDPIAEGQAKAAVFADDQYLAAYAWRSWTCLRRADAFSTVSRRQRLATLGQLGVAGRLNRHTFGADLVSVVPTVGEPLPPAAGPPLRGRVVPADAFVVLWLGGWNTWADAATAFAGSERAMSACPRVHLVATGGAIEGHDERTYGGFVERVAGSAYRDRYHLVGWLSPGEVAQALAETSVAIVADRHCAETELGCRSRIATALAAGVPAVATAGVELLADAAAAGAARLASSGDAAALGDAIVELANDPSAHERMRAAALRFAAGRTPVSTTAPIAAWAGAPRRAADAGLTLSSRLLTRYGPERPHVRLIRLLRNYGARESLARLADYLGVGGRGSRRRG